MLLNTERKVNRNRESIRLLEEEKRSNFLGGLSPAERRRVRRAAAYSASFVTLPPSVSALDGRVGIRRAETSTGSTESHEGTKQSTKKDLVSHVGRTFDFFSDRSRKDGAFATIRAQS